SAKAIPPLADDPRLNAHLLSNRTRAAALSRQQHNPRSLHLTLRRARCPAARLKHLAYLRPQPNFSCFGNHPDLESRLTQEKKWALVATILPLIEPNQNKDGCFEQFC